MSKAHCVSLKENALKLFTRFDPVKDMIALASEGLKQRKRLWLEKESGGAKMEGTNFELVGDFMELMEQDVSTIPVLPDKAIQELRLDLIWEEVEELSVGINNKDLVEIADALTDILYVVYGTGHAFGIDLDECFAEVHSSNLTKPGEDGKPVRREDGKIMKGPNYRKPDLTFILDN